MFKNGKILWSIPKLILNKEKKPGTKGYITILCSGSSGKGIFAGEGGIIFAIDPDKLDIYQFEYLGGGFIAGFGTNVAVEIGIMYMSDPKNIAGPGYQIAFFAANGPEGAAAYISGGGGAAAGLGWSAGGGAGVVGMGTYTWYHGKTNLKAIPKDILEKLLKYLGNHKNSMLENKVKQTMGI